MNDAELKELIAAAKAANEPRGERTAEDFYGKEYAFEEAAQPAVVIELATRLLMLERAMSLHPDIAASWIYRATAELEDIDNAE